MVDAFIWEQHCCLPLTTESDVTQLARYRAAGATYTSVNVAFADNDLRDCIGVLAAFRRALASANDQFVLVRDTNDILEAYRTRRLAVAFDLEDATPLDGRVEMVGLYYDLGVRSMALAYNRRNAAGGGCHDDVDEGLTKYGCDVIAEMNRVGMVVDASHCGIRTSLDMCEESTMPVIFSHSAMRALCDHPRNITDEQLRACAQTGGVTGTTASASSWAATTLRSTISSGTSTTPSKPSARSTSGSAWTTSSTTRT